MIHDLLLLYLGAVICTLVHELDSSRVFGQADANTWMSAIVAALLAPYLMVRAAIAFVALHLRK